MSAQCHDMLDWFSAIAPTVAAFAAAAATLYTARVAKQISNDSQQLQHLLVRPRLTFHTEFRLIPESVSFLWSVKVRNHGMSPAQIRRFEVLIDDKVVIRPATETPVEFWERVITAQAVTKATILSCNWFETPLSLGADSEVAVVVAVLHGQQKVLQLATSRIEVRMHYTSAFGDQGWTESSTKGEVPV
jgi:hypothetical protein